jgi:hypothetical protein
LDSIGTVAQCVYSPGPPIGIAACHIAPTVFVGKKNVFAVEGKASESPAVLVNNSQVLVGCAPTFPRVLIPTPKGNTGGTPINPNVFIEKQPVAIVVGTTIAGFTFRSLLPGVGNIPGVIVGAYKRPLPGA